MSDRRLHVLSISAQRMRWSEIGDGELLDRFLISRDEGAFAELVRRHGPMVLGVCRRLGAHSADADDVFQATFLILVRRAHHVWPRERVGRWLHGVAYKVALKARWLARRRRMHEHNAAAVRPGAIDHPWPDDLRQALDREILRLPRRLRDAVEVCELEGRPRREAAKLLGVPEGTLSSRLAAARATLARRLARSGSAALAAVALADLLADARAAVPSALAQAVCQFATPGIPASVSPELLALTQGATSMWTRTIKFAIGAAAAMVALGVGVGTVPETALPSRAVASPAPAEKEKKEQGPTVRGNVTAVDAGKNTITLNVQTAPDKKQSESRTYSIAKDAPVFLAEVFTKTDKLPQGKLSDISAGTHVTLQLSPDSKSVASITASGPGLHTSIKSIDTANSTMIVHTKSADGPGELILSVAKDVRVLMNDGLSKGTPDKEAKLSDLAEGTRVLVQLSVDRKRALVIRVQGGSLHGSLKGLDISAGTVSVTVKEDGGLVDKDLKLAKDARIEGSPNAGDRVNVQLSVFDKGTAVGVFKRE